jgi:hypothetical protein
MRNLADVVAPVMPQNERSEATRAIHGACRTLCSTSSDCIRSIQVILDVYDLPVPVGSATDFVQRIAMEYGVVAQACAGEKWITVYLTRVIAPEPPQAELSWNEVKRWVSRFFSSWLR